MALTMLSRPGLPDKALAIRKLAGDRVASLGRKWRALHVYRCRTRPSRTPTRHYVRD